MSHYEDADETVIKELERAQNAIVHEHGKLIRRASDEQIQKLVDEEYEYHRRLRRLAKSKEYRAYDEMTLDYVRSSDKTLLIWLAVAVSAGLVVRWFGLIEPVEHSEVMAIVILGCLVLFKLIVRTVSEQAVVDSSRQYERDKIDFLALGVSPSDEELAAALEAENEYLSSVDETFSYEVIRFHSENLRLGWRVKRMESYLPAREVGN